MGSRAAEQRGWKWLTEILWHTPCPMEMDAAPGLPEASAFKCLQPEMTDEEQEGSSLNWPWSK